MRDPERAKDSIAQSILSNSGFVGNLEQLSGDGGINISSIDSSVTINSGITYEDARNIALDVYKANALELKGFAEDAARKRAEQITEDLFSKLRSQNTNPPETLSDPDMQHVIYTAQVHYARTGLKDMGDILVDLLLDRAKCENRDLLQIVLNEAIETAGCLTPEQYDALSIIYILKYTRNLAVKTADDLSEYLEKHISPFVDNAASSKASFQHLQYAGCGSKELSRIYLSDVIAVTYSHCFVKVLNRGVVKHRLNESEEIIEKLIQAGLFKAVNQNELEIRSMSDVERKILIEQEHLETSIHNRLNELLVETAKNSRILEAMSIKYPKMEKLQSWWDGQASHFQLTSVGIAIGHANMRRRGIDGFDLRIWIN